MKVRVQYTPKIVKVSISREATIGDIVNALSSMTPESKIKSLQGFGFGATAPAVLRFELK
jgi:hypothetical protein